MTFTPDALVQMCSPHEDAYRVVKGIPHDAKLVDIQRTGYDRYWEFVFEHDDESLPGEMALEITQLQKVS